MEVSERFLKLLSQALNGQAEFSLQKLFLIADVPPGLKTIDKINAILALLTTASLEIIPDISTGDINTVRCIRSSSISAISTEKLLSEIAQQEGSSLEFKSSMYYDYNRAKNNSDKPIHSLKSKEVLFSLLKTLAGFMNSQGGIIYVGIEDKHKCILGIEQDYLFLNSTAQNQDLWEQDLRNHIMGKFKDGASVNNYFKVTFHSLSAKLIARISVFPKNKLTFIKTAKSDFALYIRQGNGTREIKIDEIEELIIDRYLRKDG